MNFVVLFEDNPDLGSDVRAQHMPAHLAFLEQHSDQVTAAGPLRSATDDPAGGIWLVTAESVDAVDTLVKTDPFWPTGLRKSVRILKWTQVFADGKRQV